jgi:hypothetical protein
MFDAFAKSFFRNRKRTLDIPCLSSRRQCAQKLLL